MRELVSKYVNYRSRSDVVRIHPLGDLHLGNRICDEELFQEAVAEIEEDPLARWIGMGDMTECITRKDFRHVESSYAEWLWGVDDIIEAQRKRLVGLLKPIANKCLAYLWGNHEEKLLSKEGRDIYHSVAEELVAAGAEPPLTLGSQGFVRLYLQRQVNRSILRSWGQAADSWEFVIYATHGWGGGRLEGSLALKLGRLAKSFGAHVFLCGHHHRKTLISQQFWKPKVGADEVELITQYMVGTGSFLPSLDESNDAEVYSEAKGYPPLPVGYPVIEIKPDKHRVRVVV